LSNCCTDVNGLSATSAISAMDVVNAYKSHDSDDQLSRMLESSGRCCAAAAADDDDDDVYDDDDDVGAGAGPRLSSILSDCENSPTAPEGHVTHSSFVPSQSASMMSPATNKQLHSSSFRVSLNI